MLKHQTQPTHNSCMVTCLAMVADVPVEDLWQYHDGLQAQKFKSDYVLDKLGIKYNLRYSVHAELYEGGLYILCVPSLNLPGATHQIVAHVVDGKLHVYDPGQGREGKHYYITDDPTSSWEVPLISWVVDYEVFPAWL